MRSQLRRARSRLAPAVACLLVAAPAAAQVVVANDDDYGVPYGAALAVEAFGVLDNDTLDGEPAGENGVGAELVSDVSHGTLTLGADGSFSYAPGPGFDGSDQFVYRAVYGAVTAEATVRLSACTGGPPVVVCWKEAAFLARAAALGHPSFQEGFEDDAVWGAVRSPATALAVDTRGVRWRANDFDATHTGPPPAPPAPPPNEITTGSGPARSGLWGVFDPEHGYAWGTPSACDVDTPDAHCLFHDGFTVSRQPGAGPLYGAGGYLTGSFGANVGFVIDGDALQPVVAGALAGGEQFFGVIDAGSTGWDEIQFRELDGKVGQALLIFGDDFTVLASGATPIPALPAGAGAALVAGLLAAARWQRGRS